MEQMMLGGIAVASSFAALIFLRFWLRTRDRFFLYFSLSMWIEAGHRVAIGLVPELTEENPLSYLVRLVAYGLIILAILHKNWRKR
jgi:hypothetical protein